MWGLLRRRCHDASLCRLSIAILIIGLSNNRTLADTCLDNGIPLSERKNVTVNEVSMPIGFWLGDWASAKVATGVAEVLVQEVLGYDTQISLLTGSSTVGLYAVAGCADPSGFSDPVAAGCNLESWQNSPHHIALEVWGEAKITTMEERLAHVSSIIPDRGGSMGYSGIEGHYVFSRDAESIYESTGNPIEYYKAWNKRWHEPWKYFDSIFDFDPSRLRKCNETRLVDSVELENYLFHTGDEEGIVRDSEGNVLEGACWNDSWWVAPACRHNLSQCVPSISANSGWGFWDIMQKATVFNMPIAIAAAHTPADWGELGKKHRNIPYWYTPDDTFVDMLPIRIAFPEYNAEEFRVGLQTSWRQRTPLNKFLWNRLRVVAPDAYKLLSSMTLTEQHITSLLVDWTNSSGSRQEVACRWIKQHRSVWEAWVPSETQCEAGLGLVNADGEYVPSLGDGAVACAFCPAGRFSEEVINMNTRICTLCPSGTSQSAPLQVDCTPCATGYYAGSAGESECQPCDEGFFQNSTGSSFCYECPPLAVTRLLGATSAEKCVCQQGMLEATGSRLNGEIECKKCPYGMSCALDSREVLLYNRSESQAGSLPLVWVGHMTRPSEPLTVYKCLNNDVCPGGGPGSCSIRREVESVACGECEAGSYEDGNTKCRDCNQWHSQALLFLVPLLVLVGLVFFDWAANREKITESIASASCAMVAGLTCASLQTMSVFSSLEVKWVEPMKSTLAAFSVLGFDIKLVGIGCLIPGSSGPPRLILLRQLLAPVFSAGLVIIAIVRVVRKQGRTTYTPREELIVRISNSVGSLHMLFFISIVLSGVMPMICYKHPDGGESVMNTPSVLCFGDDDRHSEMLAYGLIGLLGVALPFLVGVLLGTWRYPSLLSGSKLDNSYQMRRYYFLFRRFEPHAYFYGSLVLTRGLLICLVPVVFRDNSAAHVILLIAILLGFAFIQGSLRPWRGKLSNFIDTCVSSLLVLLLSCGGLGTDVEDAEDTLGVFGLLALIAFVLLLSLGLVYALVQRLHPSSCYHHFICHHKAHAAAQARLLQLMLQLRTQHSCFIDSDDLTNLDELFDIVRTRVKTLVVYLTRDTLRRPWCAGEVTTAHRAGIKVLRVETASFQLPDERQLQMPFESYLDPIGPEVIQAGIIESDVVVSLTWVLSDAVKVIHPTEALGTQMFVRIVEDLLLKDAAHHTVSHTGSSANKRLAGHTLVVSCEENNTEAVASAGIICIMLQEWAMAHNNHGVLALVDLPEMHRLELGRDEVTEILSRASGLVILLTAGSLSAPVQLLTILVAASMQAKHTSALAEDVITVNTPSFTFPTEAFYQNTLPKVMDGKSSFTAEQAETLLAGLFRRISVRFTPAASRVILESEVREITNRVRGHQKDGVGSHNLINSRGYTTDSGGVVSRPSDPFTSTHSQTPSPQDQKFDVAPTPIFPTATALIAV
mmetsp:Transcript_7930/g.17576  ORF Transcript_7930/g.17576 Transcript_7930/m.17576 type:complete len:1446 (+) Transcript_7930:112-4449(+)